MPALPDDIFNHLKSVSLFRSLSDAAIQEIQALFEVERLPEGVVIFKQGDRPEKFYLVYSGEVRLTRQVREKREVVEVSLEREDDFFGEKEMLEENLLLVTATTTQPTVLLTITRKNFRPLLDKYPVIRAAIVLLERTYQIALRRGFSRWLQPQEQVVLIVEKHWFILLQKALFPVVVMILLWIVLGVLVFVGLPLAWYFWLLPLLILPVLGLIWVDYRDDIYVVTDKRVISEERFWLLHATRTEAPIRTVRSAQSVVDKFWQHTLQYGDVRVQTFTGALNFVSVPHPQAVANAILEQQERIQRRYTHMSRQEFEDSIREGLGWQRLHPPPPPPELPVMTQHPPAGKDAIVLTPPWFRQIGDEIILRKHPIKLLGEMWWSILLLTLGVLITVLPRIPMFASWSLPWIAYLLLIGIPMLILLAVAWYQVEDWRSDTYTITRDQIIDREQKPLFGKLMQRTASIDSILNVSYTRKTVLANLFNYGTVSIETGGSTGVLTFDLVVDPVRVQQELFRRIEVRRILRERAEIEKQRTDWLRWIRAYHDVAHHSEQNLPK
ncbi:MAG TPA: cyclic nucleotide-binding domain-containing protein [Anaerolineales bacterium]|nr:cyclic nucleotide-binding domain-containing protein [Anaerolineales bacterium]